MATSRRSASTSSRLTQSSSVESTHPNFFVLLTQQQSTKTSCSPRCSRTTRTARSRTSGEKRFDLLPMSPSCQRLVPSQNLGRFTWLWPEAQSSRATGDAQFALPGQQWRANWAPLGPFFDYSGDIRKVIYTTIAIESVKMSLRKL